jgi:hypothetical protein
VVSVRWFEFGGDQRGEHARGTASPPARSATSAIGDQRGEHERVEVAAGAIGEPFHRAGRVTSERRHLLRSWSRHRHREPDDDGAERVRGEVAPAGQVADTVGRRSARGAVELASAGRVCWSSWTQGDRSTDYSIDPILYDLIVACPTFIHLEQGRCR